MQIIDLSTIPDPDAPNFGRNLKAWREAHPGSTGKPMSQQAASVALGVAIGTLQKWERGDRRPGRPGNKQKAPTHRADVYYRLQALRVGVGK